MKIEVVETFEPGICTIEANKDGVVVSLWDERLDETTGLILTFEEFASLNKQFQFISTIIDLVKND